MRDLFHRQHVTIAAAPPLWSDHLLPTDLPPISFLLQACLFLLRLLHQSHIGPQLFLLLSGHALHLQTQAVIQLTPKVPLGGTVLLLLLLLLPQVSLMQLPLHTHTHTNTRLHMHEHVHTCTDHSECKDTAPGASTAVRGTSCAVWRHPVVCLGTQQT